MNVKKGFYKLRNGIVVETGRDDWKYGTADVYIVSVPPEVDLIAYGRGED